MCTHFFFSVEQCIVGYDIEGWVRGNELCIPLKGDNKAFELPRSTSYYPTFCISSECEEKKKLIKYIYFSQNNSCISEEGPSGNNADILLFCFKHRLYVYI